MRKSDKMKEHKRKKGKLYTDSEDNLILELLGLYDAWGFVGGNKLWERMAETAEEFVKEGRTSQSLKSRYKNYASKKMEKSELQKRLEDHARRRPRQNLCPEFDFSVRARSKYPQPRMNTWIVNNSASSDAVASVSSQAPDQN